METNIVGQRCIDISWMLRHHCHVRVILFYAPYFIKVPYSLDSRWKHSKNHPHNGWTYPQINLTRRYISFPQSKAPESPAYSSRSQIWISSQCSARAWGSWAEVFWDQLWNIESSQVSRLRGGNRQRQHKVELHLPVQEHASRRWPLRHDCNPWRLRGPYLCHSHMLAQSFPGFQMRGDAKQAFEVAHHEPLVQDELVLLPIWRLGIESDCILYTNLVTRQTRDFPGD